MGWFRDRNEEMRGNGLTTGDIVGAWVMAFVALILLLSVPVLLFVWWML